MFSRLLVTPNYYRLRLYHCRCRVIDSTCRSCISRQPLKLEMLSSTPNLKVLHNLSSSYRLQVI